jgi:microcin C transport system substrate-binding protein
MRTIDATQYENRRRDYDYDMIAIRYGASLDPGTELREYFGSEAASHPGSSNTSGIKDPVVDALIEKAIAVKSRRELVPIIHALDRTLLFGYYCVPNYYSGFYRVAYWKKFGKPAVQPIYASMPASVIDQWWIDQESDKTIAQKQEQAKTKTP